MRNRLYGYDPDSRTYFEQTKAGQRVVPIDSIKLDINRFALGVQLEQRDLMSKMINGTITPQQWYDESARLMKLSYRASVDVARGTDQGMTDEEKKRWIALAILLLLLLNRTAENFEGELYPIDMRLLNIAGLRGGAVRSIFENWRLSQGVADGYTEGRRVLGVAEHCEASEDRPGCVDLAALGWVPIKQVVPLGDATCYDNCKCTIQVRNKKKNIFGA